LERVAHGADQTKRKGNIVKTLGIAICTIGLLFGASHALARGAAEGPVIYVESQGLYYDSILAAMQLPPHGPFQELYTCDQGLCTEFGPGDRGHHGGRWWIDMNGDGDMDPDDSYFSCPLLGPGREEP
jgi:hypothetical protein